LIKIGLCVTCRVLSAPSCGGTNFHRGGHVLRCTGSITVLDLLATATDTLELLLMVAQHAAEGRNLKMSKSLLFIILGAPLLHGAAAFRFLLILFQSPPCIYSLKIPVAVRFTSRARDQRWAGPTCCRRALRACCPWCPSGETARSTCWCQRIPHFC